jgi:hypothetical protein
MRKRVCVLGLLAIGVVICLTLAVAKLLPRQGITRANFERIEVGMTRAEVEALLGEPNEFGFTYNYRFTMLQWKSYECGIRVDFADDWVTSCECGDGRPDERTAWQKVKGLVPFLREDEDNVALSLPAPHYLRHAPQYFPPSDSFPLPKELESLEEAQREMDKNSTP